MSPGARDAIVCVAAGAAQRALIDAIGELGYAAVAVDRDPQAAGMRAADEPVVCSTHDHERIEHTLAALEDRYCIRAVVTNCPGVPVTTAARVARARGLRGLDPEHTELVGTKPGMMRHAARVGVPGPRHVAVESTPELVGFPFPLVVKPALTVVGKAGISLVRDEKELNDAFFAARAASPDGVVEVEEYVRGGDTTVVALFDDDGFHPLALFDEDTTFDETGRARAAGFAMPSRHEGTSVDARLVESATRLSRGLGVGLGFFAFRVRPEGVPVPLELHLDLAGESVAARLLPASTGLDLATATLHHLLGDVAPPARPTPRPVMIRFLFAADLESRREEKLAAIGGLGQEVEIDSGAARPDRGAEQRIGAVRLRGESRAHLDDAARELDRILGRAAT